MTLPQPVLPDQVAATIDLGTIARIYALPAFDPEAWLAEERAGCGEAPAFGPQPHLFLDISASPDATLTLDGQKIALDQVLAAANVCLAAPVRGAGSSRTQRHYAVDSF